MTGRYYKGWRRTPDTCWVAKTFKNNKIITLGSLKVSGKLVDKEMDRHHQIKGYTPYNIAQKEAEKRFPKANPIIVIETRCRRKR